MTTPRTLRSFFDLTPPDLLDADFSTLQLLSRSSHDALQSELSSLRTQIVEKDALLSSMFIAQQGAAGGINAKSPSSSDAAGESPIDHGIREAQLEALTAKVDALTEEKRKLTLALETSQAKSRALTVEVKNVRERARDEHEKRYAFLEGQYQTAALELEARRAENDRFALERAGLTAKVRALEAAAAAAPNDGDLGALKEENERLLARLKAFEDGNAALNRSVAAKDKTIGVLRTVAKTNEKANVDLQKKNLDLMSEVRAVEAQYEETTKRNIALETRIGKLEELKSQIIARLDKEAKGKKNESASEADRQQIEQQLRETLKTFGANVDQLEEKNRLQELDIKAHSEQAERLAAENKSFIESTKDLEKQLQTVQSERDRLETELSTLSIKLSRAEKTAVSTARSMELEAANKKLGEQNTYLSRRVEGQVQENEGLKNEVEALEERSRRMMGEIHTLRIDKDHLNDRIDSLLGQINGRRASSDDAFQVRGGNGNVAANSNNAAIKPQTPISPKTTRGTKRPADDQDDSPQPSRASLTIRTTADPSQQSSPALSSPPPPAPQPLRSLFDRITTTTPIDREIDELITSSQRDPRGIFIRFRGQPLSVVGLLDLVCGGPIESVHIASEASIAFLWFVRPHDAASFMRSRASQSASGIEFVWKEKPVRALDRDIATQVVRYGASRVLILNCVPCEVGLQRVAEEVGGRKVAFWLLEGESERAADGRRRGREVVLEFTELREAVECRRRLAVEGWGQARWGREGCDREVE